MVNLDTLASNIASYSDIVLGTKATLATATHDNRVDMYEKLIAGAVYSRALQRDNNADIDKICNTVISIINWLRERKFYDGPASTKYHEAFHGGLLFHSLRVYNEVLDLITLPCFQTVDIASATLIALTHDWCKIGKYEPYFRNEKNPKTHVWEEKLAYRYCDKYLGLGHGPQSLMMLTQFCSSPLTSLTFEEMAAVRWHMATWDTSSYDVDDLSRCGNNIPLVKLIQFADQLAVRDW